MKFLFFIFCFFVSNPVWAKIPNTRIQFDAGLNQDCNFVDNQQIVASLEASLKVLNQIEEKREECQSLHSNSKVFLDTYLTYMLHREQNIEEAVVEEQVIRSEIERLTLAGSDVTAHDSSLLSVLKAKAVYSSKRQRRSTGLLQSFQLASTLLEDLEKKPKCAASVNSHVIAPSIGILGQLSGVAFAGSSAFTIPLITGFANLVSRFVSYMGRVKENSYVSLESLTRSSNYYLSYKCAFKNIEKITCSLLEEEHMLGKLHLPSFGKRILNLDSTGNFKILRDLERHSPRISKLITEVNKLFNSPETFDALTQVVTLQSIFAKLDLESKNPPLKNQFYLEALKKEGFPVPQVVGIWKSYDLGAIKWSSWYHRYFVGGYLGIEVNNFCIQSARWSLNKTACRAASLTQVAEINDFIKEVIVPSLINSLIEQRRLGVQLKTFPSLQSLYTLLDEQEVYKGDSDYHEYSLSELLKQFNTYSKLFLKSPLRLFAKDILQIIKSLRRLLDARTHTSALFLKEARNTYDTLATISNNGRPGGVLYVSFIEGKIANYFDAIARYYLLQDQKVALKFAKFNVLASLYRKYQNRLVQPNFAGSSNLSLMSDIQKEFLRVFLPSMSEHLNATRKRYEASSHKKEKRELLHSCALLLPYLKNGKSISSSYESASDNWNDSFSETRDWVDEGGGESSSLGLFCRKLLKKEGGLPFLVRGDKKYLLRPEHRPSFDESCYYYYYQREVSIEQISQKFQYLNNNIRF